ILDSEAADVFLRETERLKSSKLLTLLEDGWEDRLKRSIYGIVSAGIDMFPIIMSLDDLTGERGNADKCLDIAVKSLDLMGVPTARNFIAMTTDNPTTMQSLRRKFQQKFFWILTFACFLHSLNTLVGEICSYPLIKKILTKANRAVTFFNGSHYWGGQLKDEAKRLKISRGLKKNCESRWYALVLLCLSVGGHRQPLSIICLRPDAQKKTNGLSPVASDVITIILNTAEFWPLLNQMTRITKPIVDALGNCESRQATLADCMLQLIRCARTMSKMTLEEQEDAGFLAHAKATFDRRFKLIATPIHWLALFLHPLCRKLAVSQTVNGHSLDFMIETALKIAQQWKWSAQKAMQLKDDLKKYYQCKSPFSGGKKDAREWWESIPKEKHEGIRSLAIVLASIVPHSADVERLFSDLGGIQTPRRNLMAVETMEKTGKIRSRLNYELYERARAEQKPKHRKHGHMHTMEAAGIDTDLAKDLDNPVTWIPPLDGDDHDTDEDVVEKASQELEKLLNDEPPVSVPEGSVIHGEIVVFEELDRIESGETVGMEEDDVDIVGAEAAGGWSIEDLMHN
ncbi:ribonuclease H-like domain-containing protein, partial [Mycena galericulata]